METSKPSKMVGAVATSEQSDSRNHSLVTEPKTSRSKISSLSEQEKKQDSEAAIVSSSPTSSSNSLNQDDNAAEVSKESGETSTEAVAAAPAPQEREKGKPKKDRSSLRKGKWTVEEEEYTSRIIHYFNTGLLNLPEGATLRSYLAEKLNCDPMRITKKYAGAACLGRRAQHYRDRAHPTVVEIQLARAELDHLERRFRIRIEEGHSSPLPMPPQSDLFLSLAQSNRLMPQTDNSQAMFQSWLMGMGQQQQMSSAISSPPAPGQSSWVLPNNPANPLQPGSIFQPPWAQPPVAAPGVDTAMANLAFAQAAASLAPAITQLAAENLRQQHQQQQIQIQQHLQQRLNQPGSSDAIKEYSRKLQQGYEHSMKNSNAASRNESVEEKVKEYTRQLQESYEKQMKASPSSTSEEAAASVAAPSSHASSHETGSNGPNVIPQHETTSSTKRAPSSKSKGGIYPKPPPKDTAKGHKRARVDPGRFSESGSRKAARSQSSASARSSNRRRSKEDKQAGEVLIGFLSSLRTSYEEALREKEKGGPKEETESVRATSESGNSSSGRQVTDISGMSSSQQVESSVEDSDWSSNKKNDPSSSEDSDKEQHQEKEEDMVIRKGPPRKRLKGQKID